MEDVKVPFLLHVEILLVLVVGLSWLLVTISRVLMYISTSTYVIGRRSWTITLILGYPYSFDNELHIYVLGSVQDHIIDPNVLKNVLK